MRGNVVVDGRNVLPGELLSNLGFDYRGFGRAGGTAGRATDANTNPTRDDVELSVARGAGDQIA